jgi:type I restriction enzyme, S subunit
MNAVRMGTVARVQSGFAFSSATFVNSGVRLLRNTNILPGKVYWTDVACLEPDRAASFKEYVLTEGDILLSLDRPIISSGIKVARVTSDDLPALLVQRVGRFHLDSDKINADYLFNFLQSDRFIQAISGHDQSLGVPHISPDQVEDVLIPLPNVAEQRRIADGLNTRLARVGLARESAKMQRKEATRLIHSIVRESVQHRETGVATLGDVLEEVKHGIGADWSRFPVLGATRDGLAPAKEPVGKNPKRYKPVMPGTVFYNPMRIMIGSIALADDDDVPGITSPDYVVLRGRPGIVDSRWFYHWLRAPEGERCIASLARGAVRERMLFNRLAEGEIELPPYAAQVRASNALAEVRRMIAAIDAQLRDIEMMPARLLSHAFDVHSA